MLGTRSGAHGAWPRIGLSFFILCHFIFLFLKYKNKKKENENECFNSL